VQPHQTQIACFGALRRRSTLLKPTTCHALPKRWRSWLVSARKGPRSDSRDDFLFTQSPASTRGPRRKSARWSDRRLKFAASLNPKHKSPAARFLCGIRVRNGLEIGFRRMRKIAIYAQHRNHYLHRQLQLDLFAWRPTPPWNDNRACSLVAKRLGLSVDHGSTIARLAGIGGPHHGS
jgi:hypothetical protein